MLSKCFLSSEHYRSNTFIFVFFFSFFSASLWSVFTHKNLGENIWPRRTNRQGVVCSTWNLVWPKAPFPLLQTDTLSYKRKYRYMNRFKCFQYLIIFLYTDDKKAILLIWYNFIRYQKYLILFLQQQLTRRLTIVMIRK